MTASKSSRGTKGIGIVFALQLAFSISAAGSARAADITVTGAWTPPNPNPGSEAVLGMVLRNETTEPDALLRVSCPVANFSEKRQIDIGEGGKSAREVRNIPVPPNSSVTLDKDHFHVALLQTTSKLDKGQHFICLLSFRQAGKIQVPVEVLEKAP